MTHGNTTVVAVAAQPERMTGTSLRRSAKSVGVVAVAAALVGSLTMPAAAFQTPGQASQQYSAAALASITAENTQTVSVSADARVQTIAESGLSATTPEELEAIREAARQAEEERQAALEAQRAAAAEAQASSGATAAASTTTAATSGAGAASAAPVPAPVSVPANGSIVAIAQSQLGVPYVWGAANPSVGFDCSGFTMWVYAQAGYSIPHASGAQAGYGTPVPASQVAPGDLLVWSGHVAIYAGGGQIIHAATSGKPVKYSSYSAMVAAFGTPQVRRFG